MRPLWIAIACAILGPAFVGAQPPESPENFLACTRGYMSCDHAKLSRSQANAVALAEHRRSLARCADASANATMAT